MFFVRDQTEETCKQPAAAMVGTPMATLDPPITESTETKEWDRHAGWLQKEDDEDGKEDADDDTDKEDGDFEDEEFEEDFDEDFEELDEDEEEEDDEFYDDEADDDDAIKEDDGF